MRKKNLNPTAERSVIQINSTLRMLQELHLSISYNEVQPPDYTADYCQITWNNHVPDRSNSGKSFVKLQQYIHLLGNNSYHCLLFDGSLLRVNFEFKKNFLLTQNLLWWPAPYDYGDYREFLQQGFSPLELFDDFCSDIEWYKRIKMRSPIRIDFDYTQDNLKHPQSHMHIQDSETRIKIQKPICFNRFIDFIFRNFYPDYKLDLNRFDFIEYKIFKTNIAKSAFSEIVI